MMVSRQSSERNSVIELQAELADLKETCEQQAQALYQSIHKLSLRDKHIAELEEINSKLVAAKLQISQLSNQDSLTGLPNRIQLQDRLAHAIALAERNKRKLAILFLDLDRFKNINDTLGHDYGDKVLECVAKRLARCVRSSDTLCRQGGDEFVILLSEIENEDDAFYLAEKIIKALAKPICIDGVAEIQLTTSVGISIFPKDTADAATLIKHADTAMYHAKEDGRNCFKVFTSDMNEKAVAKQQIEYQLRKGLAAQEFFIAYQPKFDLYSREIVGVEALIRWQHPQHGLLWPASFLRTAEESGLIIQITQYVMQQAFSCAKSWHDDGYDFGRISINIAHQDFHQSRFVDQIEFELKRSGLNPNLLEIEITEGVLLKDAKQAVALLHQINNLGISISIDDFGTGFSSLSYLKQLPVCILKIDSSFLSGLGTVANDGIILDAIINLGNSLRLEVVAEGVETYEQIEFLKAHNCTLGQGFNFSPPVSGQEIITFFKTRNGFND